MFSFCGLQPKPPNSTFIILLRSEKRFPNYTSAFIAVIIAFASVQGSSIARREPHVPVRKHIPDPYYCVD